MGLRGLPPRATPPHRPPPPLVLHDVQENKARSRYEEDVLTNNHTSVWGSWWRDGTWGYACCHQTVRNSYCTGRAGEAAATAVAEQMLANMEEKAREAEEAARKWVAATCWLCTQQAFVSPGLAWGLGLGAVGGCGVLRCTGGTFTC